MIVIVEFGLADDYFLLLSIDDDHIHIILSKWMPWPLILAFYILHILIIYLCSHCQHTSTW